MHFWDIVEGSSGKPLRIEDASRQLVSVLTGMKTSEVLDFCREFDQRMDDAFTWELWGVAYLINGGCGDDSFLDFRSSLIAQGRVIYNNAIDDAESLVKLDRGLLVEMFEEGYSYAPANAYEQLAGSRPQTGITRKSSPSGIEWNETRESLENVFPQAWAVYGWDEPTAPPAAPKNPWWKLW